MATLIEEQLQSLATAVERLENKAIDSHIQLELKAKLDEQIRILTKMSEPRPRDNWDKFAVLSGFLSSLLIAIIGGIFTFIYNAKESEKNENTKNRELIISETEAVNKLIPYLTGEDSIARKTALLTLTSMNNVDLATRLGPQFFNSGGIDALEDLFIRVEREGDIKNQEDKIQRIKIALSRAYQMRGELNALQQDNSSSVKDYGKALAYNPSNVVLHYSLSAILIGLSDYDSAKVHLETYRKLSHDHYAYHYLSGIIAFDQKDLDGSIRSLDSAIYSNNFMPEAYLERARAFYFKFKETNEEFLLVNAASDFRKAKEGYSSPHLAERFHLDNIDLEIEKAVSALKK